MRFTAFVCNALVAFSVTAEVAPVAPVCDANAKNCAQTPLTHLMQVNRHQFGKSQVVDDTLDALQAPEIHDHMHIVCYAEGCAEVKAKLTVIKEKIEIAKGKLKECGTSRAQLEKDLAAAAKERAVAEKGLAECGAERAQLAKDLAQCGKDRAAAEKALAKCGRERAALEAELKQCAEVDRPAAEKGLAKCGQERRKLEMELAALVEKLKGGAGGGAKPATRRRRRRNAKSKRSALVETEVESGTESDAEEEMDHEERKAEVEARLEELKAETAEFEQKLNRVSDSEEKALADFDANAAKLKAAEEKAAAEVEKEKNILAATKAAEDKAAAATSKCNSIGDKIATITGKIKDQITKVGLASKTLQKETAAQGDSLIQLMALVQKDATLKHEKLSLSHSTAAEKLAKVEAAIKESGEECDEARAEVIIAKGQLQTTGVALKTCLETKKVISKKIVAIQEARELAQQKLDECLSTKAKLKAGLDECHTRRDAAREKLQECLDRKKALNVKIDACHKKRDEARKKLAQCLATKKSLAAKIAAAKAKLGSLSAASFMEILDKHVKSTDAEEDLEVVLDEVEANNDEYDGYVGEATSAGEEESAAVAEVQAINAEEEVQVEEISKSETDASAESDGEDAAMQGQIMDALSSLKKMDADSDDATAACEAAVAQVGKSLLAFETRIVKK